MAKKAKSNKVNMQMSDVEDLILKALEDQLKKLETRFRANISEIAEAAVNKLKKNDGDTAAINIGGFKFTFEGNLTDLRSYVDFDAGFTPMDKISIRSEGTHIRWDENQLKLGLEDPEKEEVKDPSLVEEEAIVE